jgi:hypothetical protein
MGKQKNQMRKIHGRNVRIAKAKVKKFREKKITFKALGIPAQCFLEKQTRTKKTAASAAAK